MINIIILSKNRALVDFINSGKKIIPYSFLSSKNERANLTCVFLDSENQEKILDKVKEKQGDFYSEYTGLSIITDNSIALRLSKECNPSLFIDCLGDYSTLTGQDAKLREYLESRVLYSLKSLFWRIELSRDGFSDILKLPRINFKSRELMFIYGELSTANEGNYREIKSHLASIKRKIRTPKKRPHTSKQFYVDEQNFYFEAGKEDHSAHETTHEKGHSVLCDISAKFRFGVRFNEKKHFNLTIGDEYETSAYGEFQGCHNQNQKLRKKSHANIFTNDYISNL